MRMTIGTKLLLGFLCIALLVLVVGVVGLNTSQEIVSSFDGGEEHFRSIVSSATALSSNVKQVESNMMLYITLHDPVYREEFFTIRATLLDEINVLDESINITEARTILDKIKSENDELTTTSTSLLDAFDKDMTSTGEFISEKHAGLIQGFHDAASNIRKYGVKLAEYETDFLNKQAVIKAATEVNSWVKRAEGHIMLFLLLHNDLDREKFFLRHASLLEQIEILDNRLTNNEALLILDDIKPKADELFTIGTSLLEVYDEDMSSAGYFDPKKYSELVQELYSVSSFIRERAVELANLNISLEVATKEKALVNAATIQRNNLLIIIFAIIAAFVLAYFISRTLSKPIKELSTIAIEVGKGDFTKKAKINTKDEIGDLASSFNLMVDEISTRSTNLENANEELRKIKSELEIRVEERTAELTITNTELKNEIAERKQAEMEREQLLQKLREKTKELEQIVYIASHDLRSPLVNIQGFSKEIEHSLEELRVIINNNEFSQAIREKLEVYLEKDIPESLKYILTGSSKIDSLLSGLLRLSRLGRVALDVQNLNMNEMLRDISNTFEFTLKKFRVNLVITDLPNCQGDKTQINQVFSNLIDNAIKYREPKRSCVIKISGKIENKQAIFSIEDNGIGIAEEHQQKVFEIFQRIETKGSNGEGLGLSIVKRILDRHSGKIWLESEIGKGSKFFLSLPSNNGIEERAY